MIALGMGVLGAFIGFVCIYAVLKIADWNKPVSILTGVLTAAVSGGLFAIFERFAATPIGDMIYFYPVGLGYGALCAGLSWVAKGDMTKLKWLHVLVFGLVTIVIMLLFVSSDFRDMLP